MSDRVVLVTGSTSGIGEATALRFAAAGDRVVFNSVRSVEAGERLAADDAGLALRASRHRQERGLHAPRRRGPRALRTTRRAGQQRRHDEGDSARATSRPRRSTCGARSSRSTSLARGASASRRWTALRASHGAIVNVSSIAGVRPTGSSIPYAASKAALNHMTALLAKVVGPDVRVNAVAPGLVDTPWTADWDTVRGFVSAVAPLKRSGTPEDVADVIVALAARRT